MAIEEPEPEPRQGIGKRRRRGQNSPASRCQEIQVVHVDDPVVVEVAVGAREGPNQTLSAVPFKTCWI